MNDQVALEDSSMTICKSHYSTDIGGLYLAKELLGTSHYFVHKSYMVEIRMPSSTEERKLRTAGCHIIDGEEVPFIYQVTIIDIYIKIYQALECINSQDENNVNPNHKLTGCDPNELIGEMTKLSISAFRHWLDIVRLLTKKYRIGLRSRRATSHGHASIIASASEKRICSGPVCFTSMIVKHGIEREIWDEIQSELEKGTSLPIHYQFLIDAEHALEDDRLKSCIIDLAMACETYLRFSVFDILRECPEDIKSNMELANINAFTNSYFKNRVISSQKTKYNKLKNDHLNSLFDARNKLVHMGEVERVTHKNCARFIKAANDLFSISLSLTAMESEARAVSPR
ncbi:MAG: hypothetical protein L3J28_06160 [Candidatus Polarisedimenticolaceae bacterium]|nr:hypothetical protein [Candidatus Polarisedimenticolaceae bacterium]